MTVSPVLRPLTDAGIQVLLRDANRLWVGPPERITEDVRTYVRHNAKAVADELELIGNHRGNVADPRPDLESDAPLWARLLRRARALDGFDGDGCFWTLLGARCMAVELVANRKAWRLQPRPGTAVDFEAVKPHLTRNRAAVLSLLTELAEESIPADNRTEDTP